MLSNKAWPAISLPVHPKGLRSGLCVGQSNSSTHNREINFFMGLAFCTRALSLYSVALKESPGIFQPGSSNLKFALIVEILKVNT